jgi:hypothetical protein
MLYRNERQHLGGSREEAASSPIVTYEHPPSQQKGMPASLPSISVTSDDGAAPRAGLATGQRPPA